MQNKYRPKGIMFHLKHKDIELKQYFKLNKYELNKE